jgi:hypothetical protein
MSSPVLTRRSALTALAAMAFAPSAALAQPPVRFRSIAVDVSPLRAMIGDPTAAWVGEALPGFLQQAFGSSFAPGDRSGAALIARIDYLYLGPNHGTGPSGASQDTITGVLFVRGPRGTIGAETPLRAITTYYPMAVDQALVVQSNHDRIVLLAQAFAGWAPRQLGL